MATALFSGDGTPLVRISEEEVAAWREVLNTVDSPMIAALVSAATAVRDPGIWGDYSYITIERGSYLLIRMLIAAG